MKSDKDETDLGFDLSKSSSNVCSTMLLSVCIVTDELDLSAELPDVLQARRVGDALVSIIKSVVFLTNNEYSLSDAGVCVDCRVSTIDELFLLGCSLAMKRILDKKIKDMHASSSDGCKHREHDWQQEFCLGILVAFIGFGDLVTNGKGRNRRCGGSHSSLVKRQCGLEKLF